MPPVEVMVHQVSRRPGPGANRRPGRHAGTGHAGMARLAQGRRS